MAEESVHVEGAGPSRNDGMTEDVRDRNESRITIKDIDKSLSTSAIAKKTTIAIMAVRLKSQTGEDSKCRL